MQDFLNNRDNYPILYSFGAYLALIIIALVLNRTDTEVIRVVNTFVPFCALYALGTALSVFGSNQAEGNSRIWGRMVIGLLLWTVAEGIWALYYLEGWGKGPAARVADALWLAGYIPFMEALTLRYLNYRNRPGNSWILNLILVTLATLIPIAYIFLVPTLANLPGWEQRFDLLAKASYSIANIAVIPFTVLILFTVGRGRLFKVWGIISIGFLLRAAIYFLAAYAIPNNIFAGRLSTIPTITNSLLHLFLAWGIYGSWLIGQQIALVSQLKLGFIGKDKEIPRFLINSDVDGQILNISKNFLQFTNNSLAERYLGKPLKEVLGLSDDEFNSITDICSRGGFVINQNIKVSAGQKMPVPLLLTAVGALTSSDYFGLDIVLQLPNYSAEAYPLDPESDAITQNMLRRTGQQTKENSSYLTEYFITHIAYFYELIDEVGSHYNAAALAREINETAIKNTWPIRISGKEVNIEPGFDNFDNAELLKALPILYQIAEQFAIKATNSRMVTEMIQKADRALSKNAILAAQNFGLRTR
jgi:hypothetical protein